MGLLAYHIGERVVSDEDDASTQSEFGDKDEGEGSGSKAGNLGRWWTTVLMKVIPDRRS